MDGFQISKLPLWATTVEKGIPEADEFEPDTGSWVKPREQLKEYGVIELVLQLKQILGKN